MASEAAPWRRWQDYLTTLAGAFLALSPLWFELDTTGTWAVVIIGVVMAGLGLIALAAPGFFADEIAAVAIGVVAFIAPWVFSFTEFTEMAWTAWIVGVVVALSALAALPASFAAHRGRIAGHAT